MSQTTKLYAGVVVLAALGGAVYWAKTKDDRVGKSETTSAELPEIKATDDLDKLSITNGEKGSITLEKKGDKWMVTAPVQAPANQGNVDQAIKNLKDLKAKEVITATPTEDSKKDYDFVAAKQVHIQGFKGADKKVDLTFGSSGQRGQMAMVDGKPGIYAVSGYSSYLFTREVKGFRETEILKFDDANVNGFSIEKKDATLSFTKNGDKWAGTFKNKAIDRFDEDKVKDALRTLKNLNADDFADGKSLAETGLDTPEAKVTIQLKDNAGTFVLRAGRQAAGTNRYVQKDGNETIFAVASYAGDWLVADVPKFQRSPDAGAPGDGGAKAMPMDPHGGMMMNPHGGMPMGGGDPAHPR